MPEIILEGDWSPDDAAKISSLVKSLGIGDGEAIPEDLNPPQISGFEKLLSDRQKKLLKLWRKAGKKALEKAEDSDDCEDPPAWDEYSLQKSVSPLHLPPSPLHLPPSPPPPTAPHLYKSSDAPFQFPVTDGEFGPGVYLPVLAQPLGHLRIRVRVDCNPQQLITDQEFYEMESDLAGNTDLLLDGRDIRAIAREEDDKVTLLCIRSTRYIQPLGILANSGDVVPGKPAFRIVDMKREPDALTLDIELGAEGEDLQKSATCSRRSTFSSKSHLDGTKLIRTSTPALDRTLVKEAIARCKLDGISFDECRVELVQGVPDFLPKMTRAFCLPTDGVLCLCPHDPQAAIASLCEELAARLKLAVQAGAVPGDVALDVLSRAAQLNPHWWVEVLIKRYVGAIEIARLGNVMDGEDSPWRQYLNLLVGRGLQYWGNRRAISEVMAEDFRCAYDPAGLPNISHTLEWDLACPGLARMSQQLIVKVLSGVPLEKAIAIGTTKAEGDKTYIFNKNKRWQLVREQQQVGSGSSSPVDLAGRSASDKNQEGGAHRKKGLTQKQDNTPPGALTLQAGVSAIGQQFIQKLDSLLSKEIIDQKLSEVKERLRVVEQEYDKVVDKLFDEDPVRAFSEANKTDIGKQFLALRVEVTQAEQEAEKQALETMKSIRESLLTSGISREKAENLASRTKFMKSAAREIDESEMRKYLADFYQLTGGKGSTLSKVSLSDPRAHMDLEDGVMNIGRNGSDRERQITIWHEMGHLVESEGEIQKASVDWIRSRATSSKPIQINKIIESKTGTPGHFDDDEYAYSDSFISPYVGKVYEGDATEVLAMGLQHFSTAEDMIDLYRKDKEHFLFTVGAIRGSS